MEDEAGEMGRGDRAIGPVAQEETKADIRDGAWLPSVGIVYEAQPGQNVRLPWSRTLARPTFRELAPVATEEFIFGDEYIGIRISPCRASPTWMPAGSSSRAPATSWRPASSTSGSKIRSRS